MIPKSPCKDCPDRYPACHDHCERYLSFREQLTEKNRKDRMNREWFGKTTGVQSRNRRMRYE